ncbi:MAG: BatD family protein [Bacteroidales bacterium]|jgi:hypothetical protein|nr:BatD family protein [Bacteroidales bacterium]
MKSIPATLVFLLTSVMMFSQELTLTVDAPESAVAGQRFRIVYTVNSTDGQFNPPRFDASFSVQGPQQSTNRSVQWINGQMTSVSSTTLIYYVVANVQGRYTVPPAQFVTKKATVSSPEREIVVTGESATQATGQQQARSDPSSGSPQSGSEISLRLLINKHEVYVGQPVTATLKLYSRTNLSGINELKYPDLKGFLREDIETPQLRSLEPEMIDGVQYGTGVLQRFLLYPQVSGDIRIDPVQITALVQQRTNVKDPFFDDPFFDNFFSNVSTVPQQVNTQPVTIKVRPLPEPRPADFHGAVGSFVLSSSLPVTNAEVNDALTLTITLTGSGNLNLAGEPVISFPQGIEKYDPKVTVKSSGNAAGAKSFEYLLIPRNTGTFEIPPVSYTVFDPQKEKYVTLRTDGYSVTVTGTPGEAAVVAPVFMPGEDVKYLGQDIRFIRSGNGRLSKVTDTLVDATWYWMWYLLALFVTGAVLLLRREQIKRNADITGLRNRKAAKNARKHLAKANTLLSAGKNELVNAEIARALWGFLGDKLSIPPSELTREKCYAALRVRKAGEDIIAELDQVLSATEYSQYARVPEGDSPAALCKRSAALIGKLDDVLD